MERYLIQASHEPGECLETLDAYLRAGAHYLTNAEWGCQAGVHTEWVIVEAENDADARRVVPPIIRKTALLVRLNKFSPEQIREFHEREQ
jgi:hypothetical protein